MQEKVTADSGKPRRFIPSGGFRVGGARGKTDKGGPLMTSP